MIHNESLEPHMFDSEFKSRFRVMCVIKLECSSVEPGYACVLDLGRHCPKGLL